MQLPPPRRRRSPVSAWFKSWYGTLKAFRTISLVRFSHGCVTAPYHRPCFTFYRPHGRHKGQSDCPPVPCIRPIYKYTAVWHLADAAFSSPFSAWRLGPWAYSAPQSLAIESAEALTACGDLRDGATPFNRSASDRSWSPSLSALPAPSARCRRRGSSSPLTARRIPPGGWAPSGMRFVRQN